MKTSIRVFTFFLTCLLFLFGCISVINFETEDEGDNNLVIYGEINNGPGPYWIEIYKSTPFFENNVGIGNSIVRNAEVVLYDVNNSHSETLELRNGKYWTSQGGIKGEVNNAYFLSIQVEGEVYQSSVQYILPVPDIDSITYEIVYFPETVNNIVRDMPYASFYGYFQDNPDQRNRYMWKWSGTTQIKAFPELHFRRENNVVILDPLPCSGAFGDECTCCDCWVQHGTTNPLSVFSDVYQNGSYVDKHPLFSVPITSNLFDVELFINIKQYSLNDDIYYFWSQIARQEQTQGTIFAVPPGTVNGNIRNINNDLEVVWGTFSASAISNYTQFIHRKDLEVRYPKDSIKESCLIVNRSTNIKPEFWQD